MIGVCGCSRAWPSATTPSSPTSKGGRLPKLEFDRSGWFLVRAVTDLPDTYRFAMTGPYHVRIGDRPRISRRSAQFFVDCVYERARQIRLADPEPLRALALRRVGERALRDANRRC